MEGDDAYDYIDDALMSTIDVILNRIALRVVEFLEGGGDRDGDGAVAMIGPSSSSSSVAPPTSTSSITATTTTTARTSMRPGELSMLLWAYAIVDPRDRPPGWTPQDRATVDANVDDLAIVAFVVLYVVL